MKVGDLVRNAGSVALIIKEIDARHYVDNEHGERLFLLLYCNGDKEYGWELRLEVINENR